MAAGCLDWGLTATATGWAELLSEGPIRQQHSPTLLLTPARVLL